MKRKDIETGKIRRFWVIKGFRGPFGPYIEVTPNDLYVMINAWEHDLEFRIQKGSEGEWRQVVDTSLPSPDDFPEPGDEKILKKLSCTVKARSIVILIR